MAKQKSFELKDGAVFLGDSHDGLSRKNFRNFLEKIHKFRPKIPQIFLLGDMFDILSDTEYFKEFYKFEIELLNSLSKEYEIYYFEGNHDFNLKEIFSGIKVFAISHQPVCFKSEISKEIEISHGDKFIPFFSRVFLRFLRNKAFLGFMNSIDKFLSFRISKAILKWQNSKILYKKHPNFRNLIEKKMKFYKSDFIVEGHYHQDETLKFGEKIYINLNSFAVNPKLYKVEFKDKNLTINEFKF